MTLTKKLKRQIMQDRTPWSLRTPKKTPTIPTCSHWSMRSRNPVHLPHAVSKAETKTKTAISQIHLSCPKRSMPASMTIFQNSSSKAIRYYSSKYTSRREIRTLRLPKSPYFLARMTLGSSRISSTTLKSSPASLSVQSLRTHRTCSTTIWKCSPTLY